MDFCFILRNVAIGERSGLNRQARTAGTGQLGNISARDIEGHRQWTTNSAGNALDDVVTIDAFQFDQQVRGGHIQEDFLRRYIGRGAMPWNADLVGMIRFGGGFQAAIWSAMILFWAV